jgi:hypothetical protein
VAILAVGTLIAMQQVEFQESMPDNAYLVVDDAKQEYVSPPCMASATKEQLASFARPPHTVTRADVRSWGYKPSRLLLRQRDKRTTLRYGKAAVPPLLAAAIETLDRTGGNSKKLPAQKVVGKPGDSLRVGARTRPHKSGKNR